MKRFWLGISSLVFALPVITSSTIHAAPARDFKGEMLSQVSFPFHPYMGVFAGYGTIKDMQRDTGQSAIERVVIGFDSVSWWIATFGAELGVQTGNTMRHSTIPAPDEFTEPPLGTAPIQLTLKPVIDFLITAKVRPLTEFPVYVIVKGGFAYRHLQVNDRDSIPSLKKVNGEFQAGIGYEVTQHASLTAYYQGIYSEDCAGLSADPITSTGSFKHIPTQQAGFIGLEYSV